VNPLISLSIVAVVLLLGIATFHLVATLKQARRTAFALEEFLVSTKPKIEETTDRVNAILRRADGAMSLVEQGVARFTPRGAPRRSGTMDSLMKTLTTVAAVVDGATQIVNLFFQKRQEATKEESHGQQ
jgi:hypothetical protein